METTAAAPLAIRAEALTKVYPRDFHDARSLKEILTFRGRRSRSAPLVALRDVSFDVKPGEAVGAVGTNGAGKSTLLRLIAGITPPSSGSVSSSGRIGSRRSPNSAA
jgi:ABC-type polysaccharide/polyol phosphate transport system ATPase subunit